MRTIVSAGACVIALTAAGCAGDPSPANTGQSVPQQWPMPDLVGANLQDAQDRIQSLTGGAVYFTDSHDLVGADRRQVLDANWQVCTQNLEPGAPVTAASRIDLGVVKLAESRP